MIKEVEETLCRQLLGCGPMMNAQRHLFKPTSAKRVRPCFLFACGKLLNVPESKLINMACAIELIHTASLMHDDIIDQAIMRRGLKSANSEFGNRLAVLAGDQLLARAISLLANEPRSKDIMRSLSETLVKMTDALAIEVDSLSNTDLSMDSVISIADGKTGALFALCGLFAGIAADDNESAKRLAEVGNLLGRVFQINDDVKDIAEDKKNNIITLPIVIGVEKSKKIADSSFDAALDILQSYRNHKSFSDFVDKITLMVY